MPARQPVPTAARGRSQAPTVIALLLAAALVTAWGGGAAGTGLNGRGPGSAGVRTVVLDIRHSRFSEAAIDVKAGETVRFVVRNQDLIPHELIIGDQPVHDRHEKGTEAWHPPVPGEVSVAHNSVAETTYTFGTTGRLLFGCHLPGHWAYGMQGVVRVA